MSPVQTPKPRLNSARLLFVGDCTDERHVLQRFLENWIIQTAKSCEQAVAAIDSERPTVIMCEEEMPDGSWRRLLSSLHTVGSPSPPVIVLARRADERIWADVLRHGGFDVLSRPLDLAKARPALAYAAERTPGITGQVYSRRMAAQGY